MNPRFLANSVAQVSLVIMTAALTLSCKTKCGDPIDDGNNRTLVDAKTILRYEQAVAKDKETHGGKDTFCKELAAPTISLLKDDLVLTGVKPHNLVKRQTIPTDKPTRLQPLFEDLKDFHELWKQIHPNETFQGDATVSVDPELETPRALSVFMTAAFAGYVLQNISAGGTVVDIKWAVPGPPKLDVDPNSRDLTSIAIVIRPDNTVNIAQVNGCTVVSSVDAKRDDVMTQVNRMALGINAARPNRIDKLTFEVPISSHIGDVLKVASDALHGIPAPDNVKWKAEQTPSVSISVQTSRSAPAPTPAPTILSPWGSEIAPCSK